MSRSASSSPRVEELLAQMTLDEKLAQIVGFWEGEEGDAVAPLQGDLAQVGKVTDAMADGLGHITRAYGTNPVEPDERAQWLWERQRFLVNQTRLGIPALVHEECLTGLAAWKAATFPAPLCWGASFDADLVERMGELIGESMRDLGIHQGLSPVLDVVRDARWGRTEECISEDPYVVGTIGTAYVRGLQSRGVHATLKHFVGYSASQSGRNFGPVHMGKRQLQDVMMLPFEMAVLDGNVRSIMHSYTEIDGVPVASSEELLTGVLRDQWGFDGTVVADYFGVAFLNLLHHVARDHSEAAALALQAGLDIELPTGDAYLAPLKQAVESGDVDIALVDRAVRRALSQKEELGLLDNDFSSEPPSGIDLDSPAHRAVARELADKSVIMLANDGTLPLQQGAQLAVVGPNADRFNALFGCYSFANHVLTQRPGVEVGIEVPNVLEALKDSFSSVSYAQGCEVDSQDRSGIEQAVAVAKDADVAVVVVGDQAGLFGRGTSGEGCDRDDLELPGVQRELVEAVLATGTPVVLVLLTGRPYAVSWALESCAAVLQSFFPGEEGARALVGVMTGEVNPSGRLPVSIPRSVGAQPYTYLHPQLGGGNEVTNLDSSPGRPFGYGLSYTTVEHSNLTVPSEVPTDGPIEATVTVTNTGARAGDDVVLLFGHDKVGSTTRPVAQLIGYHRVSLEPGQSATVTFTVPTTRLAYSNRAFTRTVEAGDIDLWTGTATERFTEASTVLTGTDYQVTNASQRWTTATTS